MPVKIKREIIKETTMDIEKIPHTSNLYSLYISQKDTPRIFLNIEYCANLCNTCKGSYFAILQTKKYCIT